MRDALKNKIREERGREEQGVGEEVKEAFEIQIIRGKFAY